MIFERIKSEGIAHNSYFVGDDGEAVVIDPRRDCQVYIDLAQQHEMRIRYVFETHRNEDYVIGSRNLQELTGAGIIHGPGINWGYGSTVSDGDRFQVGKLIITAIHTPGHTIESTSYSLAIRPEVRIPNMVFSGDTLFVRDVGRTDLYGPEKTADMASILYDSLFSKLLPLGDSTILRPAHGAGSVCGGQIADWDESTIGQERLANPLLQMKTKDEFVGYMAAERIPTPPYFKQMEKVNQLGPSVIQHLPVPPALGNNEFQRRMAEGAVVVDTSLPATFGGAHIPGSFSIWFGGLPSFAGWILPYDCPILLVLDGQSRLEDAVRYLIRVGFDNIGGYLKGGIEGWYDAGLPAECLRLLTVHDLKRLLDAGEDLTILDVRDDNEWASGHIAGALHVYVGNLQKNLSAVPSVRPVAVLCSVGHRASIGASILKRSGWNDVRTVLGSMEAWNAAGYPVVKE
jgi:hydroxyacylglutathione hydrolase